MAIKIGTFPTKGPGHKVLLYEYFPKTYPLLVPTISSTRLIIKLDPKNATVFQDPINETE